MFVRATLLCILLSGCIVFTGPSDDRLDGGRDGGVDVGIDGDARTDAPDAGDIGPDGGGDARRFEICDNGADDDGDLLVDCADFDCVGAPDCCGSSMAGMPVIAIPTWVGAPLAAFTLLPGGLPPRENSGLLTNFSDEESQALVGKCTSLTRGARIIAYFKPQLMAGTPTMFGCDGLGSPCTDFAAIVLTPVVGLNSVTGRLPDELGIQVHASGLVELKVAGEVRDSVALGNNLLLVTVNLSPALSPGGVASVRADVTVSVSGTSVMEPLDPVYIDQRNLLSDEDGCREISGLFFAVEGQGIGTGIGAPLRVDSLACSNPSVFVRPRQDIVPLRPLTVDRNPGTSSLRWGDTPSTAPEWAAGGMGSPALLAMGAGPSLVWHVLGEASDLQPSLESSYPGVGYAIGHSSSLDTRWNDEAWTGFSANPRLHSQLPPSCLPGTCTRLPDFRDPHALRIDERFVVVSFAREVGAAHELQGVVLTTDEFLDESMRISDAMPEFTVPGSDLACSDLRDPVMVPRPDKPRRYWLFYRCGDGSHIGHISLHDSPRGWMPEGALAAVIDASAFGVDALDEFEVIVDRIEGVAPPDGPDAGIPAPSYTYRLWSMALGRAGTSLVLAVGDTKTGAASDLPAFIPYPANPVATRELVCAGVTGDCRFTGVGLGRDPASAARLRFLMAREVPRTGGGSRYEFVPFDQIWRASGAPE